MPKSTKKCPVNLPGEMIIPGWQYTSKALLKQDQIQLLSYLAELAVEAVHGQQDEVASIYFAAIGETVAKAKYEYEYYGS